MERIDDLNGIVVEDVSDLSLKTFWSRHKTLTLTCAALSIVFFSGICALWIALEASGERFSAEIFILAVLPLIAPFIKYTILSNQIRTLFLRQLSAALGFSYNETVPMHITNAQTFAIGDRHTLYEMLSGTYRGLLIRIYRHRYVEGQHSRRPVAHEETVCDLMFADSLPHILLNFKKPPEGMERVVLEGKFSDHVSVHVTEGHQVQVRQIFEPDSMLEVLENFKDIAIEFMPEPGGTRIYFVYNEVIDNRAKFLSLIKNVNTLIDRVLPGMGTVHRQTRSEKEVPRAAAI